MNIAIVIAGVLLIVASFLPQVGELGMISWLLFIAGVGTLTFGVTTNSD